MTKAIRWSEEQLAAHRARLSHVPDRPLVAPPRLTDEQQKNRRARQMLENVSQVQALAGPPTPPAKKPKYRNQKIEQDGITHDSKKEARRWRVLQILQDEGKITDLRRQVPFELAPAVKLAGEARKKPAIRYFADFVYVENGVQVIEDAKSPPTRKLRPYRILKHLMKTVLGLDIKEV